MTTPGSHPRADSILEEWLAQDEGESLEALCARHPELADELRHLAPEYERLRGALPSALESFFAPGGRDAPAASNLPQTLRPGAVLGDYRLIEPLARGGMGEVWRAEQTSLGRHVALKMVRPERVNERALAMFAREARAGGRLNHPGIVTIFDHGVDDDTAWIAMELVESSWTLREALDDFQGLDALPDDYYARVAQMLLELADALGAAHDAGVIHRDIKPQNILITPDDHPKLTDFGLARLTNEPALSLTGDFAGTYYYMSPEQVTARRMGIDHRTDIFSLGVVMYELLTLQRPFQGDTTHQVAEAIVVKEPANPCSIRSQVPRDLAVICQKCLEKDRERRYSSTAELAEDLRRHAAGEVILARSPGRVRRLVKWCRRHPTTSVAVALSGVASLSLAALGWLALRNATAERDRAQEVRILAAIQECDDLIEQVDTLWPVDTNQQLGICEVWTKKVGRLLTEFEQLRAQRANGVASAFPTEVIERWRRDPNVRPKIAQFEELLERERAGGSRPSPRSDFEELERVMTALEWRLHFEPVVSGDDPELAESRILSDPSDVVLNVMSNGPMAWHGRSDGLERSRWLRHNRTRLLDAFYELTTGPLAEDLVRPDLGWSIPKRMSMMRRLSDPNDADRNSRWEQARASIGAASEYDGLDLPPQSGLVPLGQDPESGLWEFWHLPSGKHPRRAPDGRLAPDGESGIVLVLIPVAEPPPYEADQPVPRSAYAADVSAAPFFISKYEMTQGQWLRLTGSRPSRHQPGADSGFGSIDSTHPVESVSWRECERHLFRFGLSLPTEAQWNHAARAHTNELQQSRVRFGMPGSANLQGAVEEPPFDEEDTSRQWWDRWLTHAPVHELTPSRFGLHHLLGNVSEWVRPASAPDPEYRVHIGNGFETPPFMAPLPHRAIAEHRSASVGVRPARALDRR